MTNEPERAPRTRMELLRRLFAVRSRVCWLERSDNVASGELLALTIERDVLEWVLGDRVEPPIPLEREAGEA